MQTIAQLSGPTAAPCLRVRRVQGRRTSVLRRSNPLIGKVNDPEDSKRQIKDKQNSKDSQWATPKNDNKLEKKTIGHDAFVPGAEEEGEGQDTLAEVGESGKNVLDGIKDAVTGGGKKDE